MSGARGAKVLFWYIFSYAKGEKSGLGAWPPRIPGSTTAIRQTFKLVLASWDSDFYRSLPRAKHKQYLLD